MVRERIRSAVSGWVMVPVITAVLGVSIWQIVAAAQAQPASFLGVAGWSIVLLVASVCLGGFFVVDPNEVKVLTLFGKYWGTVKQDGFHWANPLLTKRHITLRVRNFESAQIKVNDLEGNPIEIAAVVVWKVTETAEACFEVDNYEHYVKGQREAAVRYLASYYTYDAH